MTTLPPRYCVECGKVFNPTSRSQVMCKNKKCHLKHKSRLQKIQWRVHSEHDTPEYSLLTMPSEDLLDYYRKEEKFNKEGVNYGKLQAQRTVEKIRKGEL